MRFSCQVPLRVGKPRAAPRRFAKRSIPGPEGVIRQREPKAPVVIGRLRGDIAAAHVQVGCHAAQAVRGARFQQGRAETVPSAHLQARISKPHVLAAPEGNGLGVAGPERSLRRWGSPGPGPFFRSGRPETAPRKRRPTPASPARWEKE